MNVIPKEWIEIPLEQIAEVLDPWPSHRAPKVVHDGLPYVGIGDINEDGSILIEKCRKVSDNVLKKEKELLQDFENEIIVGKVGTVGKVVLQLCKQSDPSRSDEADRGVGQQNPGNLQQFPRYDGRPKGHN